MSEQQNNIPMTVPSDDLYWYELSLALERLKNNPDFKLVFLDGYMKKFAIDKVSLLYTEMQPQRVQVMEKLVAIANFESYMHLINHLADAYKTQLKEEQERAKNEIEAKKKGVKDAGF